jgi:hypothetical protein
MLGQRALHGKLRIIAMKRARQSDEEAASNNVQPSAPASRGERPGSRRARAGCRHPSHLPLGSSMNLIAIALSTAILLVVRAADPAFVTSDPNGGWSDGGYYVHNNMWNSARYRPCTSTLHAWSWDKWYVVTRMNNQTGDGAVKTYPNVHRDYPSVRLEAFESLASSFAETSPHVGIYNVAYDIWINGIAKPGCTEIMIWTENFNQVPGGKYIQDVTFGGKSYKVYRDPGSGYIAFVATANFSSETVNLLDIMKWATAKGWFSSNSTLHQICFGVEIVSTDDADATFLVSSFSIDAKWRTRLEPGAPAGDAINAPQSSNPGRSNVPGTKRATQEHE